MSAKDGRIKDLDHNVPDPFRQSAVAKIGDNPFPTNPMSDRAKGFIDQGRVKSAITNYGSFINWDFHPSGIWGDYSYLPAVSFIGAVPGHKNSAHFSCQNLEIIIDEEGASGSHPMPMTIGFLFQGIQFTKAFFLNWVMMMDCITLIMKN